MATATKNGKTNRIKALGGDVPTNGAAAVFASALPYTVALTAQGAADLLFHRWNCEAVDAKACAAKGSKAKKTDDIESYVYRNDAGELALPGEYLRQAVIHAAKYQQDPRSPRKSAMDLYKAGVIALTQLASLGVSEWDYVDSRRVVIQRNGVNRSRPAMKAGWTADFELLVQTPEYITADRLFETVALAGRLVGLADNRPTYGRFNVTRWEVLAL